MDFVSGNRGSLYNMMNVYKNYKNFHFIVDEKGQKLSLSRVGFTPQLLNQINWAEVFFLLLI